jgi:acetyltransferase-like isoleucine patch superfamily enzyme
MSLHSKLNFLREVWHWLKTQTYYRVVFKSVGSHSKLRNPLFISHPEFICIGRRVSIRDGIRLEAVLSPDRRPQLSIGDGTLVEQDVHIACHHRVSIGANLSITARCSIVEVTHPIPETICDGNIGAIILNDVAEVIIEDGVFLGIGTVVLPNVRIGRGAVIGANSVVTHDIPPFAIAAGVPAKVLRIYQAAGRESRA